MTTACFQRLSLSSTWSFLLISDPQSGTERFRTSTSCPYTRSVCDQCLGGLEPGAGGWRGARPWLVSCLGFRWKTLWPLMTSNPTLPWWSWTSSSDTPSSSQTQVGAGLSAAVFKCLHQLTSSHCASPFRAALSGTGCRTPPDLGVMLATEIAPDKTNSVSLYCLRVCLFCLEDAEENVQEVCSFKELGVWISAAR